MKYLIGYLEAQGVDINQLHIEEDKKEELKVETITNNG